MALPNRNTNNQTRTGAAQLHPHRPSNANDTRGGGLSRAARPTLQRPQRPSAPPRVQAPVQSEPEPEMDFDDGIPDGAYDDNAYSDDYTSQQVNQYEQQPSAPQPPQYQQAPVTPQQTVAQPSVGNMASMFDNVTPQQAQAFMGGNAGMANNQYANASMNANNNVPDNNSSGKAGKNKKRNKYNRNNKSELKNDAAVSESQARVWRWLITGFLVVLVLLGLKNAFIPPKTLSQAEVQSIAMQTAGLTGFPMESGASIAEAFIEAYLPVSGDSAAMATLTSFYNGTKFDSTNQSVTSNVPQSNGSVTQGIKAGPFIYKETPIDKNTANFVIGALVYRNVDNKPVLANKSENIEYKWIYFNVGVYYNDKKNTFSIDKNSPTMVAEPTMSATNDLANPKAPGSGETDDTVTNEAKDTVVNFMKAWGASDQSALSTLVSKDKTTSVMEGLNGNYTLSTDSSGLQFEAYGPSGDKYYRGLVTVRWVDQVTQADTANNKAGQTVTYTSKYVLKLEKTADGKYLVQDINPYYYVPDPSSQPSGSSDSSE